MPCDAQHTPGRTTPCCTSMKMALANGYIRMGYFWRKPNPPGWIPWRLNVAGKGFYDESSIHCCPFCGTDLDAEEK